MDQFSYTKYNTNKLRFCYLSLELKDQLKSLQYSPCLMWDGYGQWNNKAEWIPNLPGGRDRSQHRLVKLPTAMNRQIFH